MAGQKQITMSSRGALKRGRGGSDWWRELDGDDVISLEPLCDLAYEPFALPSQTQIGVPSGASASVDAYNYFDGKILSRYLISSGVHAPSPPTTR
jgi:hypothetical protein